MKRRSNKNKPRTAVEALTPARSSLNTGFVAAAILSTLGLLAAYFVLPPVNELAVRPPATAGDVAELPPAEPSDLQPAPLAQQPRHISLPVTAMLMDTEPEQQQLLAAVEQATAKFPEDPKILQIAALTYAELLQTDRAIEKFQQSLAIDSRDVDVVVSYADLLLQVGKQQEAVAILEQAASQGAETASLLSAWGEAYSQLGELEQASQVLLRGLEKFPESSTIRLRLAQAQLQLQQFEEAEKNARKAIQLGETDRAAYVALSAALVRLGKREEALEIRGRMPAIAPTAMDDQRYQESFRKFASHNYSLLGNAYIAHDSFSQAERWLLHALELDPTSVKALTALADMCHQSGRLSDALAVYERLIEVQPDNLLNYNNCASLAIRLGDVAHAERALQRATQVDASGGADLQLARFQLGIGNSKDAGMHAKIAVDRSGEVEAYLVWITALRAQGETAFALNALLKAREIAPNDPRLANIEL